MSAALSGHEDWVKSLAFRTASDNKSLVLATGSQDATIRLWNIEVYTKREERSVSDDAEERVNDDLLDAFEASLGDLNDAEEGGRQISLKRHILTVNDTSNRFVVPKCMVSSGSDTACYVIRRQQQFTVTFDALLVGHEAGITSLSWRPTTDTDPILLSASTDSSLILWSPSTIHTSTQDRTTTLWVNRQRFGDVGGQRLGGFVLGLWGNRGQETLACGWSGGWRRWRVHQTGLEDGGHEEWKEVSAITGHRGPVKALSWSPGGEYIISTG